MKLELTDRRTRNGTVLWRVLEPFSWGNLTVPAGFHTDLASVPRKIQWLLQDRSVKSRAAAGHDYGYFMGIPKRVADAYFHAEMVKEGIRPFDRWVMFKAVEWFGDSAYAAHRRKGHPTRNVNRFD